MKKNPDGTLAAVPVREVVVAPGTIWKHVKGNLYRILCEAFLEVNGQVMVVYESVELGTKWIRPKDVFLTRFTAWPEAK